MKVTTQKELDAALANAKVGIINIDSPAGVWLTIGDTKGKAVIVSGSATIEYVYGSATIESVYGSATIKYVSDSATIKYVYGSATIKYVSGSATIESVSDSATIKYVYGSATIKYVYGSATIDKAGGTVVVHSAKGHAKINAGRYVTVYVYAATVTVEGGQVIDLSTLERFDPETWCELNGVDVVDGQAILFKALNEDMKSARGFHYPVGKTVTAPDWKNTDECGFGLHVSPNPAQARDYFRGATRFAKIATALADLRPISGDSTPKAKFGVGVVLAEVDLGGDAIDAVEATK